MIPPAFVYDGPIFENIQMGDNINLEMFPAPIWRAKISVICLNRADGSIWGPKFCMIQRINREEDMRLFLKMAAFVWAVIAFAIPHA